MADAPVSTPRAPSLEYRGRVYFFCSIEERDICTANLRVRDLAQRETVGTPHVVE